MRAAGAVEELEVGEQRLAVAADADRELASISVEEQGLVALAALGAAHLGAGQRRHEDLGLDACRE